MNFEFLTSMKKLEEIETSKYILLKKNKKKLRLYENLTNIKELKLSEAKIQNDLNRIAERFLKYNLKLEACECYLRSQNFELAAQIYYQLEMWNESAEMYYLMGQFQKAAELYSKNSDYLKIMECYKNSQDWDGILKIINQFRSIMPKEMRIHYLENYFPIVLEKLVHNVDFEEPIVPNLNKKTEINNVVAIHEDDEEENENYDSDDFMSDKEENKEEQEQEVEEKNDEDQENEKEEKSNQENEKEEKKDVTIDKKHEKNVQNNKEEESSIVVLSKPSENNNTSIIDNLSFMETEKKEIRFDKVGFESNKPKDIIDMSFEQLGFDPDLLDQKILEDYEHLSHIDFDDEWLQSENHSIIGSIISSREKKTEVRSEYSGFEYIDPNSLNPNHHIIKTKGDIFIQDETMKKIIEYIQLFSEDFLSHIDDFRSKEVLLSITRNKSTVASENENFVMDLDNIDMDFLYMILDILETYNQFKLCIFVCNRYTLHQRVGRYLLSIAHRYSFLPNENTPKFSYQLLYGDKFLKNQHEKSFIASTAIHNVLENINPHYLQFKKKNEESNSSNDLGLNTFQGLIMLGCWKKCVYLMDYQKGLALTSSFGDFQLYKFLYINGNPEYNKKLVDINPNSFQSFNFNFISTEISKDHMDYELFKTCLKHNIWNLADLSNLAKNLENSDKIKIETENYPKFFELNSIYHEFVQNPIKELFDKILIKLQNSLNWFQNIQIKKHEIQLNENLIIFDIVSATIQIIFYSHNKGQNIPMNNVLMVNIVEFLLFLMNFIEKFDKLHKNCLTILESLLIPFR